MVNRFSINRVCKLTGISKNTYYNNRRPGELINSKYIGIKSHIEKIIEENSKYGVLRIKASLKRDYDIVVGKHLLSKLLIIWKLNLKRKVRKNNVSAIQKMLIGLGDKTNLIQNKVIWNPLEGITSDITEIYYAYGKAKAFLCVHKDVFSQIIYGYSLKPHMRKSLVLESLKRSITKISRMMDIRKPNISDLSIIWHQDQGSQYTSYKYVEELTKLGKVSYSKKGTPTDNPGQESFFGRFKEEQAEEFMECSSFEELEKTMEKKIHYYNNKRIHTSIGYTTPVEFTESLLKTSVSGSVN